MSWYMPPKLEEEERKLYEEWSKDFADYELIEDYERDHGTCEEYFEKHASKALKRYWKKRKKTEEELIRTGCAP